MGDLDNLLALKSMLEKQNSVDETMEREKRFIGDAAKAFLGEDKALQGYKPEEILEYLSLPVKDIQAKMGGEWGEMPTDKFDLFVFNVAKKIRKSASLIDWKS